MLAFSVRYLFTKVTANSSVNSFNRFQVLTSKAQRSKASRSAFPLYVLGESTLIRFNILSSLLSFAFFFLWADFFFLDRRRFLPDELEEDDDDEGDGEEEDEEDGEDDDEEDDGGGDDDDDDVEDDNDEEDDDDDDDDEEEDEDEDDVESNLFLRRSPNSLFADAIVTLFACSLSPLTLDRSFPSLPPEFLLKCTPEGMFRSLCLVEMLPLGADPSFPGQDIKGTLPGNAQFTEDVLTQNIAGKFWIYQPIYRQYIKWHTCPVHSECSWSCDCSVPIR